MGGAVAGLGLWRPAQGASIDSHRSVSILDGTEFDLSIDETLMGVTGSPQFAVTINGSVPAPTLRWREGDTVTVRVANTLDEDTSIHWHGVLLPANQDGVPGLSFDGIRPGETHVYRFTVRQAGTYWYHSHSMFQEQRGMYGALIVDPLEPEPVHYDREHVVLLSDWTDEHPDRVFAKLKKQSDYYNFRQPTVGDFVRDIRDRGFGTAASDRAAWGEMRMNRTDLSDVTGATYTYLMNGHPPARNWTGLIRRGERVRLRFINGSAMSYFDVRIPGLKMQVIAADGQHVHPVSVDEFRFGSGETLDVIVEPSGQEAFTIHAQAMDRSGYASGTLAVRDGLRPPVPELDPRPSLAMDDMGHGHSGGAMAGGAPDAAPRAHDVNGTPTTAPAPTDAQTEADTVPNLPSPSPVDAHGGSDLPAMKDGGTMQSHPPSERGNPLVDMQTMMPSSRLDDPGIGLRNNGRRVLTYADLHTLFPDSGRTRPEPYGRAASHRSHEAVCVVDRRRQILRR